MTDLRGVGRMAIDATAGVADLAESLHNRIARGPARPGGLLVNPDLLQPIGTAEGGQVSSTDSIRAENLFLRRQLTLYIERGARPRRIDAASRVSLALLARRFDWRTALVAVNR